MGTLTRLVNGIIDHSHVKLLPRTMQQSMQQMLVQVCATSMSPSSSCPVQALDPPEVVPSRCIGIDELNQSPWRCWLWIPIPSIWVRCGVWPVCTQLLLHKDKVCCRTCLDAKIVH